MIAVALLFDGIIAAPKLLDLIPMLDFLTAPANIMVSILVGIWAWLTFYIWFKLHGVKFTSPKRMFAFPAAFVLKLIPIIGMLPEWTGAVTLLFITTRGEEALAKTLEQTAGVVGAAGKVAGMASKVPGVGKNMKQGLSKVSEGSKKFSTEARGEAQRMRQNSAEGAGDRIRAQTEKMKTRQEARTSRLAGGPVEQTQKDSSGASQRNASPQSDIGAQPVFRQEQQPEIPAERPTQKPPADERANATAENASRTTALQQGVNSEEAVSETRSRNQASTPPGENGAPKRPNPPPLPQSAPPSQTQKPQTGPNVNDARAPAPVKPQPTAGQAPVEPTPATSTGKSPKSPATAQTPQSAPAGQTSTSPATPPNTAGAQGASPAKGTALSPQSASTAPSQKPTGQTTTPSSETEAKRTPAQSPVASVTQTTQSKPPLFSAAGPSFSEKGSSASTTPSSGATNTAPRQSDGPKNRATIKDALSDLEKAREKNRKELKETLKDVLNAVQKEKKLP